MGRVSARASLASLVALLAAVACATSRPAATTPAEHVASTKPDEHHHQHGGHGQASGPLVHRFEDAARWSAVFDGAARDAWQRPDEVVKLLEIAPGMTVVDLGAGTGYFEARLSRAVGPAGKVLALDVEPDMVRWMRERAAREGLANVHAETIAYDDPGLAAGTVDRVLVVDTWHHIPSREAYAAKLRDALAPGGWVAIVDFDLDAAEGPPREHRIAPEQVVRELAAGGLVAAPVTESLAQQYVVVGRRR